jgi:SAM-dependent methyltransferase
VESYEPSTWGDRYADVYEELVRGMAPGETEAAVEVLSGLANGGPVLELGVGTGRVAIPLAERGLEVHGIDSSEAMIDKLREQPGGDRVKSSVGDIATVAIEGRFPLAFAVLNTFSLLYDEEDQIRCIENVAGHLTEDGVLVVEAAVPVAPDARGQSFTIWAVEPDRVMVSFSRHDPRTRSMRSLELWLGEGGMRVFPARERPVPPTELDLMARIAGLRLRERWEAWDGTPFTALSDWHVSVYAKSPAG